MIPLKSLLCETFITVLLLQSIVSLHIKNDEHFQSNSAEQKQFDYLKGLQENYGKGIQSLNNDFSNMRDELQSAESRESRIEILESSIESSREKIGQLSQSLIPDSTSTLAECQFISPQKQIKLSTEATSIQNQINSIESTLLSIPESEQKTAISKEIAKMKINLQKISQVSTSQCLQNLVRGSVVYQTNLYMNENWILGSYSMDQLINEFYDRSLKYANISNCPLERPFMPSIIPQNTENSCIKCPENKPYFDVSTKQCTSCINEQSLDLATRKCGYPQRNSNYTYGPNYRVEPLNEIPPPKLDLTSCPQSKPFFNGTICIQCSQPTNYFQISEKKCEQCPNPQVFSLNLHRCILKVTNRLTILHGTNWTTNDGNSTRVWKEREEILKVNKTTGQYRLCNSTHPYYDTNECIQCGKEEQFNVDTNLCTSAPQNETYSKNLRRYTKRESPFETDPKAKNYISSYNLTDHKDIPNCNQTYPYYDDISCIYCQEPDIIFNHDSKECTICPNTTLYNETLHKCVNKELIYIYGNRNKLLATNSTTIKDYDNKLQNAVNQNPKKVPSNCPNENQYAAITQCITCDTTKNFYFNVETLTCTFCEGSPDQSTNVCSPKKYYFVNPQANSIIVPDNKTLEEIAADNQRIIQSNTTIYSLCSLDRPYPYNNKTICGKCPDSAPLYSITLEGCTYCPTGQAYNPSTRKCSTVIYLTNFDRNVIITKPETLQSLLEKESQLNKTSLTAKCPQNTPYSPDEKLCIDCLPASPYFDINRGLCVICPSPLTYSFDKKSCVETQFLTNLAAPRLLEVNNYTVNNIRSQQEETRANQNINYTDCPLSTPYGQATSCTDCTGLYNIFNLATRTCERCENGFAYWADTRKCLQIVNITNINSTSIQIAQTDSSALRNYQSKIEQQKISNPTQVCPPETPYAISGVCRSCPSVTPYFQIPSETCIACPNYNSQTLICPEQPSRYPNLTNYYWITNTDADKYINQAQEFKRNANGNICSQFYNGVTKQCVDCPNGQYYHVNNGACEVCSSGKSFDINIHRCVVNEDPGKYYSNIDSSDKSLQIYGGLTLDEIQTTLQKEKQKYSNSQYCSSETPFFDGFQCIKCPHYKQYFNLRYQLCQVCLEGQRLVGNDCINNDGNKVWEEPIAENVYPYLFSNF